MTPSIWARVLVLAAVGDENERAGALRLIPTATTQDLDDIATELHANRHAAAWSRAQQLADTFKNGPRP